MKYKCRKVNILKNPVTEKGSIECLCDSCTTNDCENPIKKMKISLFGFVFEHRVYISYNDVYIVTECQEGYSSYE